MKIRSRASCKHLFALAGISLLLVPSIIMYITFLFAFFSEDNTTLVMVNNYGEALPEFIIIPVVLIIGFWSVRYFFKRNDTAFNKLY